jgi:hypothetical protein
LKDLSHRLRRLLDRREIGDVVLVDRGGHGDDEERHAVELLRVARHLQGGLLQHLLRDFLVAVVAPVELIHLVAVDVEADGAGILSREREGHGKTDVTKADDGNPLVHVAPDSGVHALRAAPAFMMFRGPSESRRTDSSLPTSSSSRAIARTTHSTSSGLCASEHAAS